MKYKIREHYAYGRGTHDYDVELGSLKFVPYNQWSGNPVLSLWTVIENASSDQNHMLIKKINKVCNSFVYKLPKDIAIISLHDIEFLDGYMPELVTAEEMNEKLKPVMDDVVWVDLEIRTMQILSVYKLKYVSNPGDVVCSEIMCRQFCGNEIRFKSLTNIYSCKLHIFNEHVNNPSEHRLTRVIFGKEADTIWSTLISQVIGNSGYKPECVDPNYNFNRFADEFKDIVDYFADINIVKLNEREEFEKNKS